MIKGWVQILPYFIVKKIVQRVVPSFETWGKKRVEVWDIEGEWYIGHLLKETDISQEVGK